MSAMAGLRLCVCAGQAEPFNDRQGPAVPSQHVGHVGQMPCFTGTHGAAPPGRRPCQVPAASAAAPARQAHPAAYPAAADRPARSAGVGRPAGKPPLRAPGAPKDPNRHEHDASGKRQPGNAGRKVGFKFAVGMGLPRDRLSVEGPLSPYQQPNGNTSAAMSPSITNMIESQGMHFGFELKY